MLTSVETFPFSLQKSSEWIPPRKVMTQKKNLGKDLIPRDMMYYGFFPPMLRTLDFTMGLFWDKGRQKPPPPLPHNFKGEHFL